MSGFIFFLLILGVIAGLFWFVFWTQKQQKKQQKEFEAWLVSKNFVVYSSGAELNQSSFNTGQILRGFKGRLKSSKNPFAMLLQQETRGSGKSRRTYKRTIFSIDIPSTKLQMIVNSKINSDTNSGGNISNYTNKQKYQLEGDFGTFFEVFMPDTTQSETLSMLTPDSMMYILINFADYDIEINNNKMYLYTYSHLSLKSTETIIEHLDKLLEEMRLRTQDVRQLKNSDALVARTATDSGLSHRKLKRDFQFLSFVAIIAYIVIQFIDSFAVTAGVFAIFAVLFLATMKDIATNAVLRRKYNKVIKQYK